MTTQNTTKTHNNQRQAAVMLTLPSATLPSIFTETFTMAPDLSVAAPYGSAAGAVRRVRSCHFGFPCFERGNNKHRKNERKWCIGLWLPPFDGLVPKQPTCGVCSEVVMREEAQPGWSAWGGRHPIVWGN